MAQVKEASDQQQQKALFERIPKNDEGSDVHVDTIRRNFRSDRATDFVEDFDIPLISSSEMRRELKTNYINSVAKWALLRHKGDNVYQPNYPDFVIRGADGTWGYEVLISRVLSRKLAFASLRRASELTENDPYISMNIVLVLPEEVCLRLEDRTFDKFVSDVCEVIYKYPVSSLAVGYVSASEFFPITTLRGPNSV